MSSSSDREKVAARLREARARVFSSAAQAARALGMKPVTVRAHEAGQNGVNYPDLERYARRYGVDIGWLLTGKGSSKPEVAAYAHFGEPIEILTLIEDGVWLLNDPMLTTYPTRPPLVRTGDVEFAIYTDPRFPARMIESFKVVTTRQDGPYINGDVLFAVPHWIIGYREGDHVVTIVDDRERGVCQWGLRRVFTRDGTVFYSSLLSDDDIITLDQSDGAVTEVLAVVVGSVSRRPVNELPVDFHSSPDAYEADLSVRPDGTRVPNKDPRYR